MLKRLACLLVLLTSCATGRVIYDGHLASEGEFLPVSPAINNLVQGLEVYEYYIHLIAECPSDEFVVIDFKEEITYLNMCGEDNDRLCVASAIATTEWDKEMNCFRITLSKEAMTGGYLPFIMVHEWAHVLTWDAIDEGDHGPMWGVAFSRCYQALIQD